MDYTHSCDDYDDDDDDEDDDGDDDDGDDDGDKNEDVALELLGGVRPKLNKMVAATLL